MNKPIPAKNDSNGACFGLEFDVLFGKNKNMGLSTGVLLAQNFSKSKLPDEFKIEYLAHDKEHAEFRRILTAKNVEEKLSITNVSIPILFKFSTPTSETKKTGFDIEFGPLVSVYSKAKSKMSAAINYEAIYTASINNGLGYSATTSNSDWLLTEEAVTKHFSSNGQYESVSDYFDKHYARGYFVGLDKKADGDGGSIKYKLGFGGLLRTGLSYRISKSVFFKFGISAAIISNKHTPSDNTFKPIDAADDFEKEGVKFSSFLNTTKSSLTTQFGINLGIQYQIK